MTDTKRLTPSRKKQIIEIADLKSRQAEARYAKAIKTIADHERHYAALAAAIRTPGNQHASTGGDLHAAQRHIDLVSGKIADAKTDLATLRETRMIAKKRYCASLGAAMPLTQALKG